MDREYNPGSEKGGTPWERTWLLEISGLAFPVFLNYKIITVFVSKDFFLTFSQGKVVGDISLLLFLRLLLLRVDTLSYVKFSFAFVVFGKDILVPACWLSLLIRCL